MLNVAAADIPAHSDALVQKLTLCTLYCIVMYICPYAVHRNKINTVLETIYFISAADVRTYKAEIK